MDLLTQGVLGASVAYVASGRVLGRRKAVGFGALFGMLPDADMLIQYVSSNPLAELIYHRGITHSLFFAPFIAFLGAGFLKRFWLEDFKPWFNLIFWAVLTHPLLDLFTTYGTQLLLPFSDNRFSLNAVSVIDLAYSAPLGIGVLFLWFCKNENFSRTYNAIMLFLTTCYLFLGVAQYDVAYKRVLAEARNHKWCGHGEVFSGNFSIFRRRAVFYERDLVHIAHFSTLKEEPIAWQTFKQEPCTVQSKDTEAFYWFSEGHILYQKTKDGYLLQDVRFGLEPHAMDGFWGLKVDEQGNFKDWVQHSDLKDMKEFFEHELNLLRKK